MTTAEVEIEYTDRYGGAHPSWLFACFECEAMGSGPTQDPTNLNEKELATAETVNSSVWYWVKCRSCNGTGEVSALTAVSRIPRWIREGIHFILDMAPRKRAHPSEWSPSKRWLTCIWCAFGVELVVLKRRFWR
jgi:hypothetical protein